MTLRHEGFTGTACIVHDETTAPYNHTLVDKGILPGLLALNKQLSRTSNYWTHRLCKAVPPEWIEQKVSSIRRVGGPSDSAHSSSPRAARRNRRWVMASAECSRCTAHSMPFVSASTSAPSSPARDRARGRNRGDGSRKRVRRCRRTPGCSGRFASPSEPGGTDRCAAARSPPHAHRFSARKGGAGGEEVEPGRRGASRRRNPSTCF